MTVQYNDLQTNIGVRLMDTPNTIDARFNWWGTTDPNEIRKKVTVVPIDRRIGNVNTSKPLSREQRDSLFSVKGR